MFANQKHFDLQTLVPYFFKNVRVTMLRSRYVTSSLSHIFTLNDQVTSPDPNIVTKKAFKKNYKPRPWLGPEKKQQKSNYVGIYES